MKKNLKKAIAILLALLMVTTTISVLPLTVSAAETTEDSVGAASGITGDCTWTLDNDGTMTISGDGAMENYNHYSNAAPWSNYEISEVVIEEGVTNIGRSAFWNKTELENVIIPDSVKIISDYAFSNCSGLTSIYIPKGVTKIGFHLLSGCTKLTSITVSEENETFNSANNCNAIIETKTDSLIQGCKTTIIPNTVKEIFNYAFFDCKELTSLEIPESVTSIKGNTFSGCSGLTDINIPSGVTSISNGTFAGCSSLTSLEIPDAVTSIGSEAFYGCSGLTDLTIPESVTSIGGQAFDGCFGLTSINIPENVTSIGYRTFNNCSGLTSINIPENVTSIGERAFCDCSGLTSLTIPNSVTTIEKSAFSKCSGLKSVEISNSLTNIGEHVFYDCSGLTSLTIPDSVTSIGKEAFYNCSGLTSLTIPDSVTSIGERSFIGCSQLESLEIPNSVTSIGSKAFGGCTGLKSISLSENITSISDRTFYNCSGLTSMEIPSSVTSIGDYAFFNCSGLTSINISENVTSIGTSAFNGCSGLTSLEISNGVTSIGAGAFCNCPNLTSLRIPDSVTRIGNHAFGNCSGLKTINIPENVTSIDNGTFTQCSSLTSIVIPNSVTSIGDFAFYDCSSLASLEISNSVTSIGKHAFRGCNELTSLEIPNNVTSIEDHAFNWCSKLTSVIIPNSVTSIGNNAFSFCGKLTSLEIPNSVTSIGDYAFYYCSTLKSLTIPDSVTTIGYQAFEKTPWYSSWYNSQPNGMVYIGNVAVKYKGEMPEETPLKLKDETIGIAAGAFENCEDLTEIVIPNGVVIVGSKAFKGCIGLINLKIPDSVTTIGDQAFYYCSTLKSLTIPDSVTTIGYQAFEKTPWYSSWYNSQPNGMVYIGNVAVKYKGEIPEETPLTLKDETIGIAAGAFENCEDLTEINMPEGIQIIGAGAFWGCQKLKNNITIPHSVKSIGSCAFAFCEKLSSVTISDSVTNVGSYAFVNCSSLKSVTIPPSVKKIGIKAFGYYTDSKIESYENFENPTLNIEFKIIDGFSLEGKPNSEADKYAGDNGLKFMEKSSKFVWENDRWSFNNISENFSNATIDNNIIGRLKSKDYFNLNGEEYKNKTIDRQIEDKDWSGSCFGMTVSEILVKKGFLDLKSLFDDNQLNYLSKYSNDDKTISVITFIQKLQNYGKYGQIRRQESTNYGTSKETSQDCIIKKAESELENSDSVVLIEYAYKDSTINSPNHENYHAVLGYGIEDLSENKYHSEVTNKDYNRRILIADPNYLSNNEVYDNACIYYNSSDYSWICPYWDTQNGDNYTCHWNAESSSTNREVENYTGRIKSIMKMYSLTDVVDLVYTSTDYIAGITIFNKSDNKTTIEKVKDGEHNLNNLESDSEIKQYSLCDENEAELYALPDSTADYLVSYDKPSDFNMVIDYENVTYFADVKNAKSVLVTPNGSIKLEGENAKYTLTILTDNTESDTDWYSLTVSGSNTNEVTLTKQSDGYLLETDSPGNVGIKTKNDSGKTTRTYTIAHKSKISKKDKNTIFLEADTDENGTYETEVEPIIGDVNFDGSVDIKDVTAIQKHIAELSDPTEMDSYVADVNGDGEVSIADATLLQMYLAELGVKLGQRYSF